MRGWKQVVLAIVIVAASPWALSAQTRASIGGVVKDASGAVLPGVTVEACEPDAD